MESMHMYVTIWEMGLRFPKPFKPYRYKAGTFKGSKGPNTATTCGLLGKEMGNPC